MLINGHPEKSPPRAVGGLEIIEDFKYLSSQINSSLLDLKERNYLE